MGPMRAAREFAQHLEERSLLAETARVRCDLYGSLALTGHGHGTDRAVLLGLSGEEAARIDPDTIDSKLERIRSAHSLALRGVHAIPFTEASDLLFHREILYPPDAVTEHPNGMRFTAFDAEGKDLHAETVFSIGGGFTVLDGEGAALLTTDKAPVPFSFTSATELLRMAKD